MSDKKAPHAPGFGFRQVIIADDQTWMENIYVSMISDRGCNGFVLFLPTMRTTLYCRCDANIRSEIKNAPEENQLYVMRDIINRYNPGYNISGNASFIAFMIYLMEDIWQADELAAVVNVRDIRLRDLVE